MEEQWGANVVVVVVEMNILAESRGKVCARGFESLWMEPCCSPPTHTSSSCCHSIHVMTVYLRLVLSRTTLLVICDLTHFVFFIGSAMWMHPWKFSQWNLSCYVYSLLPPCSKKAIDMHEVEFFPARNSSDAFSCFSSWLFKFKLKCEPSSSASVWMFGCQHPVAVWELKSMERGQSYSQLPHHHQEYHCVLPSWIQLCEPKHRQNIWSNLHTWPGKIGNTNVSIGSLKVFQRSKYCL